MYGDNLQSAINTINNYINKGNSVYLYDNNKEDSILSLNKESDLKFVLMSDFKIEFGQK